MRHQNSRTNGNGPHSPHGKDAVKRTLIIIGGHEDKKNGKAILREVAHRVGDGKLVVTTVASHEPEGYFEEYDQAFRSIGLKNVLNLEIKTRAEAICDENVRVLDDAAGLFFTGGDQLKITSQIGDTPVYRRILKIYEEGSVIAGTSAGASVMCETMLVRGPGRESHRVGDSIKMAPGLGLAKGVIIDQHFAERGRMGRLLGAVAQNPRLLGIGIDEDTALILENEESFDVVGSGAVYVVDGSGITHSNVAEETKSDTVLSIYDVKLHVLSDGDHFNLKTRRAGELSRLTAAQVQVVEAIESNL